MHLVTTIKFSTLHMLHFILIFSRPISFLHKVGLTSITMCLESLKVLFVNFTFIRGSSTCDKLFWCSIISLMSGSSIYLGTCFIIRVDNLLFGRSTVNPFTFFNYLPIVSQSDLLWHSTNTAFPIRLLMSFTPSWSALGSRDFFIRVFNS